VCNTVKATSKPGPQDGAREQLLADIRAIFDDSGTVRMFSAGDVLMLCNT
jgi:hypothetical protein